MRIHRFLGLTDMAKLRRHPWDYKQELWPDLGSNGPNGEEKPIRVKKFAERYHYTESHVRELISTYRVYATKVRRIWYLYPHTYKPPLE